MAGGLASTITSGPAVGRHGSWGAGELMVVHNSPEDGDELDRWQQRVCYVRCLGVAQVSGRLLVCQLVGYGACTGERCTSS